MAHRFLPLTLLAALLSASVAHGGEEAAPATDPEKKKATPPRVEAAPGKPPAAVTPAGTEEKKPAAKLDVAAEIRKAEKYGGTTKSDRERLAALYILDGQISKAYKILREIIKASHPDDAEQALALASRYLREKIRKLPARGKGVRPGRDEIVARLRLAMTALALDSPPEALAALEPLKKRRQIDKFELRRLALSGLASWSAGVKDDADRDFLELIRRAAAGRHLQLRSPALVDRVICYGKYDERSAKTVRVGETVTAYVEVVNFRCTHMDTRQHLTALDLSLTFQEEVDGKDRRGKPTKLLKVRKELPLFASVRHRTRSPIKDLHLVVRFKVPPELRSGTNNQLKISVRDRGNVPPVSGDEGKGKASPDPVASAILRLNVYGSER